MAIPRIKGIDGTEKCPMNDEVVSRETCSKCFEGTKNRIETISEDTKFIKDTLVGENGLIARVSVLEAHKKEANRRMVLSLGIVTLAFSVITYLPKIMAFFNGTPK